MASYEYPAPTKKRKQATFTEDELEVMVTEVAKRKHVIFPAFSETITRRLKDSLGRGDGSCQSGGGPEVKFLLKPSEEAMLNLGLLERESD
ncbi:hypothetical protein Pcinc_021415 [Petrolisthes cinctipes]|uniref:Regulatory protein zeste n=1 Tax=Petrolisthes cinctipes TaxID=88211 RepID=A0AAE1FHY7_PETCI|nr:hypothetical protein Pcinc_021415 [Petrolisthes cinctipes]